MERVAVTSSNIVSIGYDPDSETLEVEFKGGELYHYHNVPEFQHERLMQAASHGTYLNANIKNSYPYERV